MDSTDRVAEWFSGSCFPLIISGPCSAESELQVMETARRLAVSGRTHVFRSGIWKPRSRPGSFSGAGTKAVRWMKRVREETGLKTAVEVASPAHIEVCLRDGSVDILWIGARTVSNPFSVEELSGALAGVDIPVLLKNPLSPDIDLWTGAIERIKAAGITKIAAVFRGFSPFERTAYRNMPKWEIPIELRRRMPDVPVICDPSHIAGDAALVPEIAQKAFDLGMKGLMTEVHFNPQEALSDARQQLSVEDFDNMINSLIVRNQTTDDPFFLNQLEELRLQVDSIDYQIIELVASRMEASVRMGEYKCRNNVTILQMERWLEILRTRTGHGLEAGLEISFIEALMRLLHQESIRTQTVVMNRMKDDGECNSK